MFYSKKDYVHILSAHLIFKAISPQEIQFDEQFIRNYDILGLNIGDWLSFFVFRVYQESEE